MTGKLMRASMGWMVVAVALAGCVPVRQQPQPSRVPLEKAAAAAVWETLRYYNRLAAMTEEELRREAERRQGRPAESGVPRAALARLRAAALATGKTAVDRDDARGDVDAALRRLVRDAALVRKYGETKMAEKNNELFAAHNKIKQLERDVQLYRERAGELAAQIQKLKEIEKIISERQIRK